MAYKGKVWADGDVIMADNMNDIDTGIKEALAKTAQSGSRIFLANIDIESNADVNKTDLTIPADTAPAVNDLIFDANGDTYYITAVADTTVHVSAATSVHLKGPKGETGERGPAGTAGAVGAKGEKGDKGDKGDAGAAGTAGAAGANGKGIAGVEFTFTKDANGAITAISGKYKLDGESTAAHNITCTISTPSAS